MAKFEEAKPFVNTLGGSYKANFDKTYAETAQKLKTMVEENKTIYFDIETPVDELPHPDPQNYVKVSPISD